MPANTAGRKAVLNVWNADGNIILLEFTHPDIVTQRLALAMTDVISNGNTFTAYPFEIELPTDGKGVPTGKLRISNVSRQIWDLIGGIVSPPPQLSIYRVLESDKNTIQDQWLNMDVKRIGAGIVAVEAEFGHENYASEPYPAARAIPPFTPWMMLVG